MHGTNLPVAVMCPGPVGLAAAAHLLARGETPIIFEAGDTVAHSIHAWAHVRMFSLWGFNVDTAAAALLTAAGWMHPPKETLPTDGEFVEHCLEPLGSTVLHPLRLVQAASCCGGPAPAESDACCIQDAQAKATGQAGCGCKSVDVGATEPAPAACCTKAGA